MSDDILLPDGACLVHVGPFKTGSSAIQAALANARDRLPEHGVVYPGKGTRDRRAGWAVLGTKPRGRPDPTIDEWDALVREVAVHPAERVCISNEDFGRAGPQYVERIVADLGGARVHAVIVARRLDKLLPSQWQERVRCYETLSYEEFLRAVLDDPERTHAAARAFWQSHDMAAVIDRWASQVGPENCTVIVTEGADRDMLPRTFEQMLGLPEGFLELDSRSNPSVSHNGIELNRRVNESFAANGWPDEAYHHIMQNGVRRTLQQVDPESGDEKMPKLSTWASDKLREMSRERIEGIRDSKVNVVGNLEALMPEEIETQESEPAPDQISIEAAVKAVEGAVRGALVLERRARKQAAAEPRARRTGRPAKRRRGRLVAETSSRDLMRVVGRRALGRVRRVRGGGR